MQKISYQELIDREELQRLQDEFALATGVLVYCLDSDGEEITKVSGGENAEEIVQQYATSGYIRNAFERVEEGALEDLAVEESEVTGGRVAAVAVRMEESTILYWMLIQTGVSGDPRQFENILDLLRDASYSLLESKAEYLDAELESRRNITEKQEMTRDLHVVEATTEIIQLLDSDESLEKVIEHCLRALGNYLEADSAQIFQLREGEQVMDVMGEWIGKGQQSSFDKTNGIDTVSYLRVNKPVVISTDAPSGEYHSDLVQQGLQAVMVFPILQQENSNTMVLAMNCRDKKPNWGMQDIKFVSDAVKVLQSILTRRIQRNAIDGARLALKEILDNVSGAIYVVDQQTGERLFANQKLQRQFVMELQDGSFHDFLKKAAGEDCQDGSFEVYHEDVERWYDLLCKEITWTDGRKAVIYTFYDITDKKDYQKEIEQQAYTDSLTGLSNRLCFEKDLGKQIIEAKRIGGTGALLYLDLDDFKHINDGLGHKYGDVLLQSIAHSLQKVEDIENTCYRIGGDEFVVIIEPQNFSQMEKIVSDIQKIFSKPWFLKDKDYYCTMSMGIVTFPDSGDSVQELVKKADIAMYEAKKNGKNGVSSYEEGIELLSGQRLDMEKNMRDAVLNGCKEFEVYYQPVINITEMGTECVGAEALLRWNSEQLGFLPPAEFIPLAEYLGLINPIGNYVLREACKTCKSWNDNGYPDYRMSVNLSVVQLLQKDIVETVCRTIQETGIDPSNLVLEVTESLAIKDMQRTKEILGRIKELGVGISLDDFGTGYSSLSHIREIPFDTIKVDRSFVLDLTKDAYSQSFVKMVTELAHTLGAHVVVEGIEVDEQCRILRDLQVHYAQGYLFDKPLPRQEFEEKYVDSVDFI